MPHSEEIPDIQWWKEVEERLGWKWLWQVTPICFGQFNAKDFEKRDIGLHLHFCSEPEFGDSFNDHITLVKKNGWFVKDGERQVELFEEGVKKFMSHFRQEAQFFTSGWFRCSKEVVERAKELGIVVVDKVGNKFDVTEYGMYSRNVLSQVKLGKEIVVAYTHTYEYSTERGKRMFETRLKNFLEYSKSEGYENFFGV